MDVGLFIYLSVRHYLYSTKLLGRPARSSLQNDSNFPEKAYRSQKFGFNSYRPLNNAFYTVFGLSMTLLYYIYCKQSHLYGKTFL